MLDKNSKQLERSAQSEMASYFNELHDPFKMVATNSSRKIGLLNELRSAQHGSIEKI